MARWNSKGYDYAALMVLVVIICVGTLYYVVTKETKSVDRNIGDIQVAVLKLNSETTLYELFVKEAAKIAIDEYVANLKNENCITITEDSWIDWQKILQAEMNKQLNSYLAVYEQRGFKIPRDSFEIVLVNKKFIGIAILPTEIVIKDKTSQLGKALFNPSFEIDDKYKLYELPQIVESLKDIAEHCENINCAQNILKDWQVAQQGELLRFYKAQLPCFAVSLT